MSQDNFRYSCNFAFKTVLVKLLSFPLHWLGKLMLIYIILQKNHSIFSILEISFLG